MMTTLKNSLRRVALLVCVLMPSAPLTAKIKLSNESFR